MGCMQSRFKCCAAPSRARPIPRKPRLVIAGATGVLGNEVLRRLVGLQQLRNRPGAGARAHHGRAARRRPRSWWPAGSPAEWPPAAADSASSCSIRRACSTTASARCGRPRPGSCSTLAQWMRRSGVPTPWPSCCRMRQGRLPEALKRGLARPGRAGRGGAGLRAPADRALGAEACAARLRRGCWRRLAHWMLSVFKYMVPSSEQPVRAAKVARVRGRGLAAGATRHPRRGARDCLARGPGRLQAAVRQWLQR